MNNSVEPGTLVCTRCGSTQLSKTVGNSGQAKKFNNTNAKNVGKE
jgi:hypothetical protein